MLPESHHYHNEDDGEGSCNSNNEGINIYKEIIFGMGPVYESYINDIFTTIPLGIVKNMTLADRIKTHILTGMLFSSLSWNHRDQNETRHWAKLLDGGGSVQESMRSVNQLSVQIELCRFIQEILLHHISKKMTINRAKHVVIQKRFLELQNGHPVTPEPNEVELLTDYDIVNEVDWCTGQEFELIATKVLQDLKEIDNANTFEPDYPFGIRDALYKSWFNERAVIAAQILLIKDIIQQQQEVCLAMKSAYERVHTEKTECRDLAVVNNTTIQDEGSIQRRPDDFDAEHDDASLTQYFNDEDISVSRGESMNMQTDFASSSMMPNGRTDRPLGSYCAICLEGFQRELVENNKNEPHEYIVYCGYSCGAPFHSECIVNSFEPSKPKVKQPPHFNRCPLCRNQFKAVLLVNNGFEYPFHFHELKKYRKYK